MTVNRVVIIAVVAIAAAAVAGWFLTGLGGGQRLLEPEAVTGAVRVDPDTVTVGERVSWSVSFVPGPDGFPHGGRLMIRFPHNHFSTVPASEIYQDEAPEAPGYAGVTQPVSGVRLEVRPIEYGRIGIFLENNGPDLPGEETIDVAILNLPAPPVAQNDFLFQVIVDRDGDGEYGIVRSVNPVRVLPGAPERLACVAQSLIDPGARPWIGCRLEDARGNPTEGLRGNLHASVTASGRRFSSMTLARSLATQRFEGPVLAQPGVYTIDVEAQTDERVLSTATNLVLAERREDGRRLLWADLHGHSALSDGRGTPEEYYEYARDVSFLDAAALSDHDWQLTETEFRRTVDAAEQFNARGAFVTVPAMEINIRGHELIYFFDTDRLATVRIGRVGGAQDFWQELFADMAPGVPLTSYKDMLAAFNDDEILIASHTTLSAGMGTPRGDPAPRQSLIEIYSAHGSSECAGCPAETPDGDDKKKTSVRYWLNQGYRWGVIAAGDTHDGRPGNSLFSAADGGLAGLYVNEFSRHGVRRALAERRVFGTNGCRALLDFETGGAAMGGVAAGGGARTLRFRVVAAGESMRVVLVKNGEEIAARDHYVPGLWSEFTDTSGGDAYYYLRAEGDRGFYSTKSGAGRCLVWSSPIWVISP